MRITYLRGPQKLTVRANNPRSNKLPDQKRKGQAAVEAGTKDNSGGSPVPDSSLVLIFVSSTRTNVEELPCEPSCAFSAPAAPLSSCYPTNSSKNQTPSGPGTRRAEYGQLQNHDAFDENMSVLSCEVGGKTPEPVPAPNFACSPPRPDYLTDYLTAPAAHRTKGSRRPTDRNRDRVVSYTGQVTAQLTNLVWQLDGDKMLLLTQQCPRFALAGRGLRPGACVTLWYAHAVAENADASVNHFCTEGNANDENVALNQSARVLAFGMCARSQLVLSRLSLRSDRCIPFNPDRFPSWRFYCTRLAFADMRLFVDTFLSLYAKFDRKLRSRVLLGQVASTDSTNTDCNSVMNSDHNKYRTKGVIQQLLGSALHVAEAPLGTSRQLAHDFLVHSHCNLVCSLSRDFQGSRSISMASSSNNRLAVVKGAAADSWTTVTSNYPSVNCSLNLANDPQQVYLRWQPYMRLVSKYGCVMLHLVGYSMCALALGLSNLLSLCMNM